MEATARNGFKHRLTALLTNEAIQADVRKRLLSVEAMVWLSFYERDEKSINQAFDEWNSMIAEVVDENNLRRH